MPMCVPTISEAVTRKLLAHFGTIAALQRALASEEPLPKVRLDGWFRSGKARIARLREVLVDRDGEEEAEDEAVKKEE